MKYDIAIIGAGPGGYVAAIKASQLGAKVALIEKDEIGGVCLNRGCMPSKATLASLDRYLDAKKLSKFGINAENINFDYKKIAERKNSIVEKLRKGLTQLINSNKIDVYKGEAQVISSNSLNIASESEFKSIEFQNLIIATGAKPASLNGLAIDHKFILDTDDILKLEELPESVLIVGSGASGIEWARIFSGFGKKVILTEIADRLAPMHDISQSERLERLFKRSRIEFYTNTSIKNINNKEVTLSNDKTFTTDIIFLAAGRTPNSQISGLESIQLDEKGFVKVDENFKTSIDNVYAIGDVNGIMQLAHVASHQGVKVVEYILQNKPAQINYNAVPKIIYGHPEIASVGITEAELLKSGESYYASEFALSANGRSLVEDDIEGFVKVLATKDEILGVHIIASHADGLIQQCAIAMNSNLSPDDIKETIFAHPTQSESLHEAFLGINGDFLHLPKKELK